jgi:hypothetical protein
VSKTAAVLLALVCLSLFSIPMSAQLIPHGNVYAGVSYGQFVDVIPVNRQSYRGWNGSAEFIPFARFSHFGLVADASGFYRTGITQYNFLGGPRLSARFGKWRPFVHVLAGVQRVNTSGNLYQPTAVDFGGGVDYKLFFKNFSWRLQGDYVHTHYLSANQNAYRASTGIVWRF